MYESILDAIRQELQTVITADPDTVDFAMVRKLADIAIDIQASSVTSVEEIGTPQFGTGRAATRPAAYGPSGTERMISEVLPQIASLLEGKFASDSLSSLSALLETYVKVSNPDTPGFDQDLATELKNKIEKYLKEEKHEDIHTDTTGGHQPDA